MAHGKAAKQDNRKNVNNDHSNLWMLRWTAVAALSAIGAVGFAKVTYDSTVDTAKKQLRSYIGVENIQLQLPSSKKANYLPSPMKRGVEVVDVVVLTLKNFGSTPASEVTTKMAWHAEPFLHQPHSKFSFPDPGPQLPADLDFIVSKCVVFPGQPLTSRIAIQDITPFLEAAALKKSLYLYGHVDYQDIYGQTHTTKFCYAYQPNLVAGSHFLPYSRFNEAD